MPADGKAELSHGESLFTKENALDGLGEFLLSLTLLSFVTHYSSSRDPNSFIVAYRNQQKGECSPGASGE
jgi:hypothetical protein